MKRWVNIMKGVAVAALALVMMLGQFWILYLAPLLIFLGMGIAYGFLSSQGSQKQSSMPSDSSSANPPVHNA
ncbi:hypothetical protein [Sulfobacillus thermosulfidooxidans]|uniref:hypothetical protein n=1 Tax=Sulfobacillus thermosulfidooxidans TaxID=28034 RepID=UPI0006B53FEC|nr:hypothetical protein [Sulfobacillus thermosulfidooxidans]